jgi:chromatin assembly factor 1 subunit B
MENQIAALELRWHYPHDIAPAGEGNCLSGKDADKEGAVLSVDWHPTSAVKFLTSGFDGAVKVWSFDPAAPLGSSVSHLSTMFLNERSPCNVARWAPTGNLIAAAYNSGEVVLWRRAKEDGSATYEYNAENWSASKILRMHAEREVYTLCFSPDMRFLASGGFDGTIAVYDMTQNYLKAYIESIHQAPIQGMVWDPLGTYLVTVSVDRRVVITANLAETGKGEFMTHDVVSQPEKGGWLFRGDGASAFYRHVSFSPDATMLAVPCGWISATGASTDSSNCCYLFFRHVFQRPYRALCVTGDAAVMGSKFSPVLYEGGGGWGPSEYSMALAVFSSEVIVLFSTALDKPVAQYSNMHYAPISDVSWCCDGKRIVVSSEDGACTIATVGYKALDLSGAAEGSSLLRTITAGIVNMRQKLKAFSEATDVHRDKENQPQQVAVRRKKRDREDGTDAAVVAPAPDAVTSALDSTGVSAVPDAQVCGTENAQSTPPTN